MRRGLLSSSLSSLFSSRKNKLIILIVILVIIGGLICIYEYNHQQIKITPSHNDMGHYVHPAGEYWNDYFEYRMYADITGLPNDGKDYYCLCSFYDTESGQILDKSKLSLANYSLKDPNKDPCGILRWHTYRKISKVEVSVYNNNGTLITVQTYKWNNKCPMVKITDSVYSEYF